MYTIGNLMKHKVLQGFRLNELVFIPKENRWDKIAYIDDHVHGNFCMSEGGRYFSHELIKDKL